MCNHHMTRVWSTNSLRNSAELLIDMYQDTQDALDACKERLDRAKSSQTRKILNKLMDALMYITADAEVQGLDF